MFPEIPEVLPIYLLVMGQDRTSVMYYGGVTIWHIIKSIPCDMRDFQQVWDREVTPLNVGARYVAGFLVAREPDSIVRDRANADAPKEHAE